MKKYAIGVVHKWRYPHRGRENLPKGDIAPKAYLVKWVTRGREGSKISKIGDVIHRQPLIKKNANHFNKEIQSTKIKKIIQTFCQFSQSACRHLLLTYTKFWFASCFHFSTFSFQHFDPFFILFNIWKKIY